MERWSGRVALVTGAAGGMGSAITVRLVKAGMKVAACDLSTESLQSVAIKLQGHSGELLPIKCNLRKEQEILAMFKDIKEKYGGVDICLNVAALGKRAPLLTGDTELWREILEINVLGLSICTREAIKSMRERGVDDGHIIHWNSLSGHRSPGIADFSMYVASKHAVTALTEELRRELRLEQSNIRISSISPGFTKTGFFERMGGEEFANEYCRDDVPMLSPDNVADTVIYMLSCPPEVQVHDILIRPTQMIS